mgnify:CR=1 FL=1
MEVDEHWIGGVKMKYVIVGNSAAAVRAVEGIRNVDKTSPITIISREEYTAYSPILTTYLIADQIKIKDMVYRDYDWYEKLKVDLVLNTTIAKVDSVSKKVIASDGKSWSYDKLLIATGASPFFPNIQGVDLRGVFGIRTLKDALEIKKMLPGVEKAVVIGGGLVSCKAAEALRKKGIQVEMVISSKQLLSKMLDKELASTVQKRVEKAGINLRMGRDVTLIEGQQKVEGVRLDSGEIITCQMVVVGKGVRPNVGLVDSRQIKIDKGILVDSFLQTSSPDVYAAGDVAQVNDMLTEKQEVNAIWPEALEQGYIAGLNMAGESVVYPGSIKRNTLNLFGLNVASIGFSQVCKDNQKAYFLRKGRESYWHLIMENGYLVGATAVGDIKGIGVLASFIKRRKKLNKSYKMLNPSIFIHPEYLGV